MIAAVEPVEANSVNRIQLAGRGGLVAWSDPVPLFFVRVGRYVPVKGYVTASAIYKSCFRR